VGIDASEALLRRANATGSQYVRACATRLPFTPESFDVVTCGYVTQYLEDSALLDLFREVRRVLAYGGIALVWDFSPTRSWMLNAFHERVLNFARGGTELRNYTTLSAYALEAGFEWVSNAHLRPFLFPPIPRVSIIAGKAPIGWKPDHAAEDLVPDTHARSFVAGVTREPAAGSHHDERR
jgi:SAM-dependent methyltransferase